MKCPAGYGEPRAPCNMEKVAAEIKVPALKTSPLKGCVHFIDKTPLSPCLTTTTLPLNDNTRGVHNKENTKERNWTLGGVSLNCDGLEESGYASLQNSYVEKEDEDHDLEEQLLATSPRQRERQNYAVSTPLAGSRDSSLPILNFQRAVCQELAENFKRTQSYDWTVIGKLAKHYNLDRVIGGHMGRESVDVFAALLERDMRHILTRILGLLGDVDLINCRRVSRTWRRIITQDASALRRCQQAEQRLWDSRASPKEDMPGLTRNGALSRVVLSCMQTVASNPAQRSSKRTLPQRCCAQTAKNSQPTRFREYQEAASSLKQHESLKPCKRCGSPARHDAPALRAVCTRQSCAFDFCTRCQSPFHGSSPCRTVPARLPAAATASASKDKPILIGSARSKRNLRRL